MDPTTYHQLPCERFLLSPSSFPEWPQSDEMTLVGWVFCRNPIRDLVLGSALSASRNSMIAS